MISQTKIMLKQLYFSTHIILDYNNVFSKVAKDGRVFLGLDARTYGKPFEKEGQRTEFGTLRATLLKLVKRTL